MAYRSDIQGLRGIAVLAVILFHFNPALLPGGFVGVDVFFVLSGYLITGLLLNKKAQENYCVTDSLKYFYASRFKRIMPAYYLMLIVVSLIAALLLISVDFNIYKDSLNTAIFFNSNSYFSVFGDYFSPDSDELPLLHTWSPAVEIQFYLLIPIVVLLSPRRWLVSIIVFILILCLLISEYRLRVLGIGQSTYYSLYARLPEFLAGGLAAIYALKVKTNNGNWLSFVGLFLIIVSMISQPQLGHFPGVLAMLPALGSVLILLGNNYSAVGKLLSNEWLVWVGALSYSLYLWHWPVLAFLRYYAGQEILGSTLSFLFFGLTLALSSISYFWVENYFRGNDKVKTLVWRSGILLSFLFVVVISSSMINNYFTSEQLPIEYRQYSDASIICHGSIKGECLKGDLSSSREILVLGDSHGAMLNHFFDHIGKELGFSARVITASSCVTIPDFDFERLPDYSRNACENQIKNAIEFIEKSNIIFLAASWNFQLGYDEFSSALEAFFVDEGEKEFFILPQEPLLKVNPLRLIRFNKFGLNGDASRDNDYLRTNELLSSIADRYPNVHYLKFDSISFFDKSPFFQGDMMYYDEHHLNEVGSKNYAINLLSERRVLLKQVFLRSDL